MHLHQGSFSWDRLKGLILRRLNAYCGTAAIHKPQPMRCTTFHLVDCSSWNFCCRNAQAAMHKMEGSSGALRQPQCTISRACCDCRSLLGWVEFRLPQRRNISPFIPSLFSSGNFTPKFLPLNFFAKRLMLLKFGCLILTV